jgi:hypothetical protein
MCQKVLQAMAINQSEGKSLISVHHPYSSYAQSSYNI